jgi:hypothetical protein
MLINEIRPPVSSNSLCTLGGLVMDEIARRLARAHDVIAYCARRGDQQKVEQFDGVEYRRVSTRLDRDWRIAEKKSCGDRPCRLAEPAPAADFSSALSYRQFIGEVISLEGMQRRFPSLAQRCSRNTAARILRPTDSMVDGA